MTTCDWDTIIVGGSAAGLSAALMLGRSLRRTLVIDAGEPRNRFSNHMQAVLGHDGLNPAELVAQGRREVERYGVELRHGYVTQVRDYNDALIVHVGDETLTTRSVVLATGITDVLPPVDGIAERWGTSVLHCPYCHGWEVRGQRLGVLVTEPGQSHQALLARQLSEHVTVFVTPSVEFDPAIRARLQERGVTFVDAGLSRLEGPGQSLTHAITTDGVSVTIDAIFAAGTPLPHDRAVASVALERADFMGTSVLATDATGRTSHPRIWAAGNVMTPWASVPIAMSQGALAGASVNATLAEEDNNSTSTDPWPDVAPAAYWEDRYSGNDNVWSGRVNATLATTMATITPPRGTLSTALDLACGEGGDAVWLAQQGWITTGVDISATAIERARNAARALGLDAGLLQFEAADLGDWAPATSYDLVVSAFMHSPVALDREAILHRAASWVNPGGYLLVVTHAEAPPWAEHAHQHVFPTPEGDVAAIGLGGPEWEVLRAEMVEREGRSPSGQTGLLRDGVILARRR